MTDKLIDLIVVAMIPFAFVIGGLIAFPQAFIKAWRKITKARNKPEKEKKDESQV